MSNQLQVLNEINPPALAVLRDTLYPGASDQSIAMVVSYCQASGLDFMQKPVHIVPMWDSKSGGMRDAVMPGISLYRIMAERTGLFAGVSEPEWGPVITERVGNMEISYPQWCRITVHKFLEGQPREFTAEEWWQENYAIKGGKERDQSPNAMWAKRPRGQLAKCAEAQALRKAFPSLASIPTAEEMSGKSMDAEEPGTGAAEAEILAPIKNAQNVEAMKNMARNLWQKYPKLRAEITQAVTDREAELTESIEGSSDE